MNCRFSLVLYAAVSLIFVQSAVAADADPIKVSAKDLTAAYAKDANAAAKKYGDSMNPKEVIVTGTVAAIVDGKYGKIAKIEGDGKVVVSCLLRKEDEASLKKGDDIVIKGKCRGYFKADKSVDLNGGVLVKDKDK